MSLETQSFPDPAGHVPVVTTSTAVVEIDQLQADQALRRRVEAVLAARHIPVLRRLNVEARLGVVTLRGNVHTFYEKQVSQLSAQRVAGVRQVDNLIDVEFAPPRVSQPAPRASEKNRDEHRKIGAA